MDKIEKIRQEIERRLNILTNVYAEQVERKDEEMMNYYHGKVIALEELRPFLDTLSEEPDKSLEEAAIDFADNARKQLFTKDYAISSIADYDHGCIDGFKAGADWQKEQMLKDAVEGEARVGYPFSKPFIDIEQSSAQWCNMMEKFMNGDKVRIVIVKEEEK